MKYNKKDMSIENGIKKTKGKYERIVDRTEAIRKAIKMANKRDIIVLAGKGHEQYQEINKKRYPFDENKIVKEIIKEIIEWKRIAFSLGKRARKPEAYFVYAEDFRSDV